MSTKVRYEQEVVKKVFVNRDTANFDMKIMYDGASLPQGYNTGVFKVLYMYGVSSADDMTMLEQFKKALGYVKTKGWSLAFSAWYGTKGQNPAGKIYKAGGAYQAVLVFNGN